MNTLNKNSLISNKLHQYKSIITSIAHMSDFSNLDERALFLTAHVNYSSQLAVARHDIYWQLNKHITGKALTISAISPALCISDDVEGSRQNHANTGDPVYPHLHGIMVLPSGHSSTDNYVRSLESSIHHVDGICPRVATWKAKMCLVDVPNANSFIQSLKARFPVIVRVANESTDTNKMTLRIARGGMEAMDEKCSFLTHVKQTFPEILTLERVAEWKPVDVRPYDYGKSLFEVGAYASKLLSQTDTHTNGFFDSTVCPFAINKKFERRPRQKQAFLTKADELVDRILADPSLCFSEKYIDKFGGEFSELRAEHSRDQRLQPANYNDIKRSAAAS